MSLWKKLGENLKETAEGMGIDTEKLQQNIQEQTERAKQGYEELQAKQAENNEKKSELSKQIQQEIIENNDEDGTWTVVKQFDGSGALTSETFKITSNIWRIRYESKKGLSFNPFSGLALLFTVKVQNPVDLTNAQIIINNTGKKAIGSGCGDVLLGEGIYQLFINSTTYIKWNVSVEMFKPNS